MPSHKRPGGGGFHRPNAGQNADTPHPSQVRSLRETGFRVNRLEWIA